MNKHSAGDLRSRTELVRTQLNSLIAQLRDDIEKVSDPKAEALFETTAEVLDGLDNAFKHYAEHSEKAWQ